MALPEKYTGQHVQCPDCQAMLRIPTAEEDLTLIRWFCTCGQRLKARTRTGGRKVRCPKCSSEVSVPFSSEHSSFVEEHFALDEESGIVQRVAEMPHGNLQPAEKPALPAAKPAAKKPPSASAPEGAEKQAPAPAIIPDSDDSETRIHPKGETFHGTLDRAPAAGVTGETYEVAPKPPEKSDPAPKPPQTAKPAKRKRK
jgi:DNA-directed RNA polymerase subunit M/transcription elongation factor TFIIS